MCVVQKLHKLLITTQVEFGGVKSQNLKLLPCCPATFVVKNDVVLALSAQRCYGAASSSSGGHDPLCTSHLVTHVDPPTLLIPLRRFWVKDPGGNWLRGGVSANSEWGFVK